MKSLTNTRGETLLESIVSILIFTVLMATVTTILLLSLRITSASTEAGREMQESVNHVIAHVPTSGSTEVLFTLVDEDGYALFTGMNEDISIPVYVYTSGGFRVFSPPQP